MTFTITQLFNMASLTLVASVVFSTLLVVAHVSHAHPHLAGGAAPRARNAMWDSQSAAVKQDMIWSSITSNEESWPWPGFLEQSHILLESMNVTFDTVSDVLPAGRHKLIHSEGYVFKFKFVPTADSPYTGGFAGSDYGIGRLSFAVKPSSDGIVPGSAWKFLRDGIPSGDMIAMNTLDIIPNFNFFETVFSNHLTMPSYSGLNGILDKLIAYKFETASQCIFALGVSNVALNNQDGSPAASFASPFQVFLDARQAFPDSSSNLDNWPQLFAGIPPGSPLYDVYALNAPDSEQQLIGTLYTNSAIVPSMYGDTELFFEHQRMDGPNGDLAYNPQWQQQGLNLQKLCHH